MEIKKTKIFVLMILFCHSVFASNEYPVKNSVQLINKKIISQKKEVILLSKKIGDLEQGLGQQNQKYLTVLNQKQEAETIIFESDKKLKEMELKLESEKKILASNLGKILANSFSGHEKPTDLVIKKILIRNLKNKLNDHTKSLKQVKHLSAQVELSKKRLEDFYTTENELAKLIRHLEEKKQLVAHKYLEEVEKQDRLEKQKNNLRIAFDKNHKKFLKSEQEQIGGFKVPISDFLSFAHEDKGVTYKYRGKHPLTASKPGKIIYTGRLSTYGDVIMIDHGNETRSVILGNLNIHIKKDDQVKDGQLLGHTKEIDREGNLYFEVRKKNIVQNTLPLIDEPQSLAQNSFKRIKY